MGKGNGSGAGKGEGGEVNESTRLFIPGDPSTAEHGVRGGTVFSMWSILTQNIIGSGMLGLPNAFAKAGLHLGVFFLFLFAMLSAFGQHLLTASVRRVAGDATNTGFFTIASAAAPRFTGLIDLAVSVKCFGVATSYLIVVGDTLPKVVPQLFPGVPAVLTRREPWICASVALLAPLAFLKKLNMLRFTARLSLGIILFITVLVFSFAVDADPADACPGDDDCHGEVSDVILNMNTAKVLTTFIFGYTCHQNVFAITNELITPTSARVDAVIVRSVGTALVVYLIIAIGGYLTYGINVQGDILNNYPTENSWVMAARGMTALLVTLSYPLQVHPGRKCLTSLIDTCCGGGAPDAKSLQRMGMSDRGAAAAPESDLRHNLITASFLGCSLSLALVMSDLGKMLSIVGATGSTLICYILPGFIYFIIHPEPHLKRWLALLMGILGVIIVPTALTLIFI